MKYSSTRGKAPEIGLCETIIAGLASDGGLYMPNEFPMLSQGEISDMQGKSYEEIALVILKKFVDGEIPDNELEEIVKDTCKTFSHQAVTPLVQIQENQFVLELFHGPTLAFKDLAMQLLARLIDYVLTQSGENVNVIGATSGDTGAAAVEAFGGRQNCKLFILFPKGKVSSVQEKQITNSGYSNVFAVAVEGDFDDCQALVKKMFNDAEFKAEYNLIGVNSINWGRIMAQIIYYFVAATALGAPKREINFCVPTGNFGDIFAGYCAKKMGLPINKLIVATNSNDILKRAIDNGEYKRQESVATISPSMDIQISSNFERLLFEESGKDADYINRIMNGLEQKGEFEIGDNVLGNIKNGFLAGSANENDTKKTIKKCFEENGYLADPHTAVALKVAEDVKDAKTACVVLATAHPAKFPEAVVQASGVTPELPENVKKKIEGETHVTEIKNNIRDIKQLIVNKQK